MGHCHRQVDPHTAGMTRSFPWYFHRTASRWLRQADKTVRLWDAATGKTIHTLAGHRSDRRLWCFHRMASCWRPRVTTITVRLWETATGQPIHTLAGHEGSVYVRGVFAGRQVAGVGEC